MAQNFRSVAASIIDQVTNGSSLSDQLEVKLKTIADPRDRALVQAICYGVCRYYFRLDILLSFLLKKPMRERDSDVHALLLVGLFQILEMRVPPHAAVAETVNAAKQLKKPWCVGLINALLREFLRDQERLYALTMKEPEALFAHPDWMIEKIKRDWPNDWEQILIANNAHPPFALRVNNRQCTRDDYLTALRAAGFSADTIPHTDSGVMVSEGVPVETLPGFKQGWFSVQDGAAQLCANLLMLSAGQLVLDAAAAPGGKLTHLLEKEPHLERVVAIEKDPNRLNMIKENLQRLALDAVCISADAAETDKWWDGVPFDRILLDAPCSASGVIRRHPDIKLLRRPTDLKQLAQEQTQMLTKLWPLLKEGGLLLYATCSIFPEENNQRIEDFLAAHPDAHEEKMIADWGMPCIYGRQILPGRDNMDGFYYARLRKESIR